jgi:hypothetical protein
MENTNERWLELAILVDKMRWVPPTALLCSEACNWTCKEIEGSVAEEWLRMIYWSSIAYLLDTSEEHVNRRSVFEIIADVTPSEDEMWEIFVYMRAWKINLDDTTLSYEAKCWNKLVLIGIKLFDNICTPTTWSRFAVAFENSQGHVYE